MERRNFLKLVGATLISPTLLQNDVKPFRRYTGGYINVSRIWGNGEEVDVGKFVGYLTIENSFVLLRIDP